MSTPEFAERVRWLRELAAKATPGNWGVEDPMAPECLSVVANPGAQVYDWVFICNLMMPDEDDHDFTSANVRANAAYIAAANPRAVSELLDELERAEAKAQRLVNLVTHIHSEAATLEDFDADAVMKELAQAVSGEKQFDDNAALSARIAKLEADLAAITPRTPGTVEGWRCFHCNEVFSDHEAARLHFGSRPFAWNSPLCIEPDIARRLRDAEDHAHEMFQLKTRAEEALAAQRPTPSQGTADAGEIFDAALAKSVKIIGCGKKPEHAMSPEPTTPTREDCEIYSPEASDGGPDWPTRLVTGAIIIAVVLFAYWVLR